MSSFSSPELPPEEVLQGLVQTGIVPANFRLEDLQQPSPDVVFSVFTNLFAYLNPLGEAGEDDFQMGFDTLEVIDNPEHHADAVRIVCLHNKIQRFLEEIHVTGFTLRDLLKPEPRRTAQFLSALVNFIYYEHDKSTLLDPLLNEFPDIEGRHEELNTKIDELTKKIKDHELKIQMEEPDVQLAELEIKELKQILQNLAMQQKALKANKDALTNKEAAISGKISQADFELVKLAQENSKLLSMVVHSPDKLQSTLEEKKLALSEARNSEKLAMQRVQERAASQEVNIKVSEKLSRHLSKIQALQEQITAAKSTEKEVKALKAKLSDESVSIVSLEAKIIEREGKAKQLEDLLKATENERDSRIADGLERLDILRSEIGWQLKCLEPRERQVEAMVSKGHDLCAEAESVRAAAKVKQQELHAQMKAIVEAFRYYQEITDPLLERVKELEKQTMEPVEKY